jgi:hypothetical protein
MRRPLLFLFLLLFLLPSVHAIVPGMQLLKVPIRGGIQCTSTTVEARIENGGYYKLFVSFPKGWSVNLSEGQQLNAYSYALLRRGENLREVYGPWGGPDTLLGSGEVFLEKGFVPTETATVTYSDGSQRFGFWVRANEGVRFEINFILTEDGGVIDPLYLEREEPNLVVKRWNQEFRCETTSSGYVRAPWLVKGGNLTYAFPAPLTFLAGSGNRMYYYDKYVWDPPIPQGGRWFTFRNSLTEILSDDPIAPLSIEFYPIEPLEPRLPVWKISYPGTIRYRYEWERIGPLKSEAAGLYFPPTIPRYGTFVPEWFEWF